MVDLYGEYVQGLRDILREISEKKHLTWEEVEKESEYWKSRKDYDETTEHYLYTTISALDSSFKGRAGVERCFFDYEDFINQFNN